jgi:hypothetical protein
LNKNSNVEVSDTTGDATCTTAGTKIFLTNFIVLQTSGEAADFNKIGAFA